MAAENEAVAVILAVSKLDVLPLQSKEFS